MASIERTIERAQLLARLAAERAGLLEQLIGLEEEMLTHFRADIVLHVLVPLFLG